MSSLKKKIYQYLTQTLEEPLKSIGDPYKNYSSHYNTDDNADNTNYNSSLIHSPPPKKSPSIQSTSLKKVSSPSTFDSSLSSAKKTLTQSEIPNTKSYEELRKKIFSCTKCILHQNRTNQILQEQDKQNFDSKLMVISDYPSHYDQIQGRYMSENYGMLFARMLTALGFSSESIYLSSALKCHSRTEIMNKLDDLSDCEGYLKKEIFFLPNLEMILGLGETTYRYLMKNNDFEKNRGKILNYENKKIIFTYHPKELHNNQILKEKSWKEDLKPNIQYFQNLTLIKH